MAEEAEAHEAYEDALAALEFARTEGDEAEIRRRERELEEAKRRWRNATKQVRNRSGDKRRATH